MEDVSQDGRNCCFRLTVSQRYESKGSRQFSGHSLNKLAWYVPPLELKCTKKQRIIVLTIS